MALETERQHSVGTGRGRCPRRGVSENVDKGSPRFTEEPVLGVPAVLPVIGTPRVSGSRRVPNSKWQR